MVQVRVTVTGARELTAALQALGRDVTNLDLGPAGRAVEAGARSRARRLTGAMAGSITSRPGPGPLVQIGATVPWTAPQHQGTRRGVTPNPFLTDALTATTPAALSAVDRSLADLIRRHNL